MAALEGPGRCKCYVRGPPQLLHFERLVKGRQKGRSSWRTEMPMRKGIEQSRRVSFHNLHEREKKHAASSQIQQAQL